MAPAKDQPKRDIIENVSKLAKVNRLRGFEDLSLIDNYAQKFGLDPDWVYDHTSFGTIVNFAVMWKEQSEYNARFNYIWQEVNSTPSK